MILEVLKFRTLLAGLAAVVAVRASGMTAAVMPSVASPAPLGTMVTFTAAVSDAPTANLWYRFRVRGQSGQFQIVRDYGPANALGWTATMQEGFYDIEVSARDLDTGDESTALSSFQFQSLVTAGAPVVSPTANPLVFIYSAPGCRRGSRMLVEFQLAGGGVQSTPFHQCTPESSMNFYLAGLQASSKYTAHHVIEAGATSNTNLDLAGPPAGGRYAARNPYEASSRFITGPDVSFATGTLPSGLYADTIVIPGQNHPSDPILLGAPWGQSPVANDLAGNVIWYGPSEITFVTHVESGGAFWGVVEKQGFDTSQQIVREFDLAGMTLRETNAARVNEQLTALGKRTISSFHHEARSISGGRIVVLAALEQILTDVQGPGPVDVIGDMIIVLDSDLNVVWTWDTFDNLDVHRAAILGEACPTSGCPPYHLAASANDWTHGNAVSETPDGNLLYSSRHQDWLVKVSYNAGQGDGHIIWRMGVDGDFQINSSDPYPWFSHQHDGNFETTDPSMLMVFDDGNTRVAMQRGNSRGQVMQVDEQDRIVTPVLNADLGVYSSAVGSAQHLADGNYHFDAGFVGENGTVDSYSFEIDPGGNLRYEARQNTILYRTFRMSDMYTPN